ncbi:polyprenyl synthetase family protein [Kitasatospora sp. NPDC089509]|uniref:polyprenyl synthetase family protein n=1 Tax=Kitasatospora sp. NPDC089509 TaxID=3364079 RepID=UPI0037F80AA2
MTNTPDDAPPGALDVPGIRAAVERCLDEFLTTKEQTAARHRLPPQAARSLRSFIESGGKRLRPLLCALGWYAAGGHGPPPRPVLRAASALEMFHAFALIHDDIMDRSETRRGRPTLHRALAHQHADQAPDAAAEHLGASAAILIGDLALCWSDELLHTAGLPADRLHAVRHLSDLMREEAMYGQYLDLLTPTTPAHDLRSPLTVIRYKTAKYTCERPLHIGAALAGAGPPVFDACTAFAIPLGEAFQLRDDLLGVFGEPERTGKSRLDDLREGKRTVLMALAHRRANPAQSRTLHELVGRPGLTDHDADRIRTVLIETGARDEVENMIRHRHDRARQALDRAPFPPPAVHALRHIAHRAAHRTV